MAQVQELKAEAREGRGKGPSYQARQKGLIPAIVYGPPPSGMGSTDEHVTVEHFFHTVKTHVLSAYDYMSKAK